MFNKSELFTNKKLLKAIALTMLFTSSLNAFDFKFITTLFSKETTKIATVRQSSHASGILSCSPAKYLNVKSLLGKLGDFVINRPKTFIALSAVTLFSVIGFIWRKPIRKKINEIRFVNAYKIYDIISAIKLSKFIDPDRATELIKNIDIFLTFPPNWDCKKITVDMVQSLIINNSYEYYCNRKTQLHFACKTGKLEIVKKLLTHKNINVNLANQDGDTPLHFACSAGELEIVKELLKHKDINLNLANKAENTPLHITCERGELEIAKELLKHKDINVNLTNRYENTPLYIALQSGHLEVVKELLKHENINVNLATNYYKKTLLHLACHEGKLEIAKELLQRKDINLNLANKDVDTPLHITCERGELEIAKELLKHKDINVNLTNQHGSAPLHLACSAGKLEIVKELLKHEDININPANQHGSAPLHLACSSGGLEIVKELLKHKDIDINLANKDGNTSLHLACEKGRRPEIAKELLTHKDININLANKDGNTPLHIACEKGWLKIVKELLKHVDININLANKDGDTPLNLTCLNSEKGWLGIAPEIAKELLKHKDINVNIINKERKTALYNALKKKSKTIMTELLKHKNIDLSIVYKNGNTILHLICAKIYRYREFSEPLLRSGADPDKKDNKDHTPLYKSIKSYLRSEQTSEQCFSRHLRILLESGACIDNKSKKLLAELSTPAQIPLYISLTQPLSIHSIAQLALEYNKPETNKLDFVFNEEKTDKSEQKYKFKFLIRLGFGRLLRELNEKQFIDIDKIIKDSVFFTLYNENYKNIDSIRIFLNSIITAKGEKGDIKKFIENESKENGFHLKERLFSEKRNFFNNLVNDKKSFNKFGDCRIITVE